MPELPDIVVCIEALEARIRGERLGRVRIAGPLLLRTAAS
jgi:formamidopyrimidine-DNA glycosylase